MLSRAVSPEGPVSAGWHPSKVAGLNDWKVGLVVDRKPQFLPQRAA
jgi:hypothetical protein